MAVKQEFLSYSAFARSIKVSEGAVRRAIREGKFTQGVDATAKKICVKDASKDLWVMKQTVVKPKAGVSRVAALKKIDTSVSSLPEVGTDGSTESWDVRVEDIKIRKDMAPGEIMRLRELIGAALDKKKLAEAEGVLIRRDSVEKVLFAHGSRLKKAIMAMPERIIDDVLAAPNKIEALNIMKHELTQILTSLSDAFIVRS